MTKNKMLDRVLKMASGRSASIDLENATQLADQLRSTPALKAGPPLVLALAVGYSKSALTPFVRSIRHASPQSKVVVFVSSIDMQAVQFLIANGVYLIPFDPNKYHGQFIQNSRWFFYLEYLLELAKEEVPRAVLFTDIRDVVFQSDPFAHAISHVEFCEEHSSPTLGECRINSAWIKHCFGEAALEEFARRTISCSGTVLANGVGALDYLIEMYRYHQVIPRSAARKVADQAVHNFLLNRGLVRGARRCANGERILTLGYMPRSDFAVNETDLVETNTGKICPIIHQYDRFPDIVEAVHRRFGM